MKRTYEQSLSFFTKRNTCNRGFNRELYFTPLPVIKEIVSSLIETYPTLKNKVWVDPCSADGRWGKVINTFDIECINYDITPMSSNVIKQDFLLADIGKDKFYIGNPPFTLVNKFVKKALSNTDMCYFLGGSCLLTGKLATHVKLLHRFEGYEGNQKDKRSKIIFNDTLGNKVLVWCCGALFTNDIQKEFTRNKIYEGDCFAVSPKLYCVEDERVKVLSESKHS